MISAKEEFAVLILMARFDSQDSDRCDHRPWIVANRFHALGMG